MVHHTLLNIAFNIITFYAFIKQNILFKTILQYLHAILELLVKNQLWNELLHLF